MQFISLVLLASAVGVSHGEGVMVWRTVKAGNVSEPTRSTGQSRKGSNFKIGDGTELPIQSPNYPNNFPSGKTKWKFTVEANVKVEIACNPYHVPGPKNFVEFKIGKSKIRFDEGSASPQIITYNLVAASSNYKMLLTLVGAKKGGTGGGFSCIVKGMTEGGGGGGNDEECGKSTKKDSKIIGGNNANIDEYPWLVITYPDGVTCGGSLIANNVVLTAAHCVDGVNDINNFFIDVGCTFRNPRSGCAENRKAAEFTIHPGWDGVVDNGNDFAVVRLDQAVDLSDTRVGTVCLPTGPLPSGVQADTAGWGLTDTNGNNGQIANQLQDALVLTTTDSACFLPNTNNDIICVSSVQGRTCSGDSGGYLGRKEGQQSVIYGVTSFVFGDCSADFNMGFSDVADNLSWITQVLNNFTS